MKSKQRTIPRVKWVADSSHTEISFKVKYMMLTMVRGVFREYKLDIHTIGEDFTTADINFLLKAASIDTGDSKRDEHLKSNDFFDVKNFRDINFSGSKVIQFGPGAYYLDGDLTIKGITRPVRLEVDFGGALKDPAGNLKAGFSVSGSLDRREWDLKWNAPLESGGVLVGDKVLINIEIQLIKSL